MVLGFQPSVAIAQVSADYGGVNGGAVRIGVSTTTCDAAAEGAIRFNTTDNVMEFCDGASWTELASSACDNVPAVPVFADQTNVTVSTLTSSNIAAVTGMDVACTAVVGVSGDGSPEYRVCSDSGCSTVDQTWTSANNTIAMQGKYVQLRATSSASVATAHTIDLSIGSVTSDWVISTGMSGCSPEGTVCADGTVYAGLSGASTPMYVTRCDAGQTWDGAACTGTRTTHCWNNCNTTGYVATSTANTDGQTYTTTLTTTDSDSITGGTQQHIAAQYCADLSLHGHSDWYLPAKNELNTMHTNKTVIANFDTGGSVYWSSSESNTSGAWYQRFSDGSQNNYNKASAVYVRCARR